MKGKSMVQEYEYLLSETAVSVSGTIAYFTDQFDTVGGGEPTERQAPTLSPRTVSLRTRGDIAAPCQIVVGGRGADTELQLQTTTDGRLDSIQYKSVGVGPRLVLAAAKILGTVAGAAFGFAPIGGAGGSVGSLTTTPDQRAYTHWSAQHSELVDRRELAAGHLRQLDSQVFALRVAAAESTSVVDRTNKMVEVRQLDWLRQSFATEVEDIDKQYREWRTTTISSREVALTLETALMRHPIGRKGDLTPDVNSLEGESRRIFDLFNIVVQLEPSPIRSGAAMSWGSDPEMVYWRQPELREISIWRKPQLLGSVVPLEKYQASLEYVIHKHSTVRAMPIHSSVWGEDNLTLQFDDKGAAVSISTTAKDRFGLVASAVGSASAEFAAGVQTVAGVLENIDAFRDADGSAAKTRLENRLAAARAELDMRGVEATAEDFATLQRLEQEVKIAGARGTLAPQTAEAARAARVEQLTKEAGLLKALKDAIA
ncbi:hypothetical protein [Rhodococcoides yunnanense]|uniref:Uncharacterized protein n=1 Tax=Rhodococcoides yunnanense TaxID=278209 RepID=A0ABU4BI86_9NOCA|nr:hypothetical protein [Rhodococcus yunnanensis]MDV6263954.1 hypothetical protein [Rhodococcus yunnanensis]